MKLRFTFTLPSLLLLAGALLALAIAAAPAHADTDCDGSPSFEPGLKITPSRVDNRFNATLTVFTTGSFPASVWVELPEVGIGRLDPDTPLAGGETQFTVTLPAGIEPDDDLNVIVRQDAGTFCEIDDALHVFAGEAGDATDEPTATPTETPTPRPTEFVRPLVVVPSYGASSSIIRPEQTFEVQINFQNVGQLRAFNVVANFIAGDLRPRTTGGVLADTRLEVGEYAQINQVLTANPDLIGETVTMEMQVSYTDEFGTNYEESFLLVFDLNDASSTAATATPTLVPRSQLVITGYETDIEQLQPGQAFTLTMQVRNQGATDARDVAVVLGGSSGDSAGLGGTPSAGGVSGSGGSFANFAPLGSSNVQALGDVPAGAAITVTQQLVVNTSTRAGAYTLPISFTYVGRDNQTVTDDQVITLLVYQTPLVEISFYRPLDPFVAGQVGILPVQVVNLGRQTVTLGSMNVTAPDAVLFNNSLLIGSLESGGFLTLDAEITPAEAGPLDVTVRISYTDDFNQPQVIEQVLTIDVQEGFDAGLGPEGAQGFEGGFPIEGDMSALPPENFGQVLGRLLLGFLGLDSARPQPQVMQFSVPEEGGLGEP